VILRIAIVVAQHRDAELAAAALAHQLVDLHDGLDRRVIGGDNVWGSQIPGRAPERLQTSPATGPVRGLNAWSAPCRGQAATQTKRRNHRKVAGRSGAGSRSARRTWECDRCTIARG